MNALQNECRTQQEWLDNNAQANAMSAFTMTHSSWTSWGLASLFPQVGIAYKVISVVQAGTAVAHGYAAKKSHDLCQDFKKFEKKLMDIVLNLREIKNSLKEYELQYLARIDLWDYQQVSQWVKALGPEYVSIGEAFERDEVNGEELLDMDHKDLEEDYGIKKRLFRKRLLKQIAALLNN